MPKPRAKKREPKGHARTSESMIAWTCSCGGRWMNEKLKGKSDAALVNERELAFDQHVREMEGQGF